MLIENKNENIILIDLIFLYIQHKRIKFYIMFTPKSIGKPSLLVSLTVQRKYMVTKNICRSVAKFLHEKTPIGKQLYPKVAIVLAERHFPHKITFTNKCFEETTGYSKENLLNKPIIDLLRVYVSSDNKIINKTKEEKLFEHVFEVQDFDSELYNDIQIGITYETKFISEIQFRNIINKDLLIEFEETISSFNNINIEDN